MGSVFDEWNMKCPRCHKDDRLDIAATVHVRLTSDGTDIDAPENGDHEWEDDSLVTCQHCGNHGRVSEFSFGEKGDPEWTVVFRRDVIETAKVKIYAENHYKAIAQAVKQDHSDFDWLEEGGYSAAAHIYEVQDASGNRVTGYSPKASDHDT